MLYSFFINLPIDGEEVVGADLWGSDDSVGIKRRKYLAYRESILRPIGQ
jgi:hypothetical protein